MNEAAIEKRVGYEQLIARLKMRFPRLEPIAHAPWLFRFRSHTFVIDLRGRRDEDPETGTYVATWAVSICGLPLWMLGAYRVLDWDLALKQASSGTGEGAAISRWCKLKETILVLSEERSTPRASCYILGKESMSGLARTWNIVVVAVIVFLIFRH